MCFVVLNSGDYYMFESDSEDEDVLEEEQKQQKQTAFQVRQTDRHRPGGECIITVYVKCS